MQENMQTLEDLPAPEETLEEPTTQEVEQDAPAESKKGDLEPNLRELRRSKEAAERERDEYLRRLQQYEDQQRAYAAQKEQPAAQNYEIGDDDLAEGKHLKALRKEMEAYREQALQTATEARIKSQYPDFDNVVSSHNIERLRTAYPEIAATLASSGDLYNKASSAYTIIKQLGIHDNANHQPAQSAIKNNTEKPRPSSSVSPQAGSSPLDQANAFASGLTDELKAKLYREMMEIRKQH